MFENSKDVSKLSRQRLDLISHHFMGDSPTKTIKRRAPIFLAILVDDDSHKNIITELNEKLIKNGVSSCIVKPDHILTECIMSAPMTGDIYLLPYTREQLFVPELFKKAVIIVTASSDKIRDAYTDIKLLNSHSVQSIGIIMAYSDNVYNASQYFTKLAKGVRQFLGFDISQNGYFHTIDCNKNINEQLPSSNNGIEEIATSVVKNWLNNA